MLIKCSVCGVEKEEIEFTRRKNRCRSCCYTIEYENKKKKMADPITGEAFYLKRVILREAKRRSREKNLEFNLTLEYLISLKNNTCPILGHEILYMSGVDKKRSASLDRIDPNKGYVMGNVKIVSFEGNTLKNRNDINSTYNVMRYQISSVPPEQRTLEMKQKLTDLIENFY